MLVLHHQMHGIKRHLNQLLRPILTPPKGGQPLCHLLHQSTSFRRPFNVPQSPLQPEISPFLQAARQFNGLDRSLLQQGVRMLG